MLVAGPVAFPAQLINLPKEKFGPLAAQYPFLILTERAVIPRSFVQFPIQKPHPQQVVFKLLAE
jgi:hypothetical protein